MYKITLQGNGASRAILSKQNMFDSVVHIPLTPELQTIQGWGVEYGDMKVVGNAQTLWWSEISSASYDDLNLQKGLKVIMGFPW